MNLKTWVFCKLIKLKWWLLIQCCSSFGQPTFCLSFVLAAVGIFQDLLSVILIIFCCVCHVVVFFFYKFSTACLSVYNWSELICVLSVLIYTLCFSVMLNTKTLYLLSCKSPFLMKANVAKYKTNMIVWTQHWHLGDRQTDNRSGRK